MTSHTHDANVDVGAKSLPLVAGLCIASLCKLKTSPNCLKVATLILVSVDVQWFWSDAAWTRLLKVLHTNPLRRIGRGKLQLRMTQASSGWLGLAHQNCTMPWSLGGCAIQHSPSSCQFLLIHCLVASSCLLNSFLQKNSCLIA